MQYRDRRDSAGDTQGTIAGPTGSGVLSSVFDLDSVGQPTRRIVVRSKRRDEKSETSLLKHSKKCCVGSVSVPGVNIIFQLGIQAGLF